MTDAERHQGADGRPNLLMAADQAIICNDSGITMEGHLSVATIETLNKILRTCRNMRHVIGREPTPEELAGRLSMPRETIRKLFGVPSSRNIE